MRLFARKAAPSSYDSHVEDTDRPMGSQSLMYQRFYRFCAFCFAPTLQPDFPMNSSFAKPFAWSADRPQRRAIDHQCTTVRSFYPSGRGRAYTHAAAPRSTFLLIIMFSPSHDICSFLTNLSPAGLPCRSAGDVSGVLLKSIFVILSLAIFDRRRHKLKPAFRCVSMIFVRSSFQSFLSCNLKV